MASPRSLVAWLVLAVAACGPKIPFAEDDGGSGGDSAGDDTGGGSVPGSPSTTTTAGPDPDPSTTANPTGDPPEPSTTGGDPTTGGVDAQCLEPPPSGEITCQATGLAMAAFGFGLPPPGRFDDFEPIDAACTVEQTSHEPGVVTIDLDCDGTAYHFWWEGGPQVAPSLGPGDPVTLRYEPNPIAVHPNWTATLRDELGNLMLVAFRGRELPNDAVGLEPLAFELPTSHCVPDLDDCVVFQNTGLRVTYNDGISEVPWVETVFHETWGNVGVLDSYFVVVDSARKHYCVTDIDCDSDPTDTDHVAAILVFVPEG
jgi:hypothetical protein